MKRWALLLILLLCQAIHLLASLWMLLAIVAGSGRADRIALSYDQLVNAVTGGSEDETVSSRAYRGTNDGVWRWCLLCRLLDYLEKDHCRKSAGV